MGKHTGKRSNVTFPPALYEAILALAESETRPLSQMVVTLCSEALRARGIEYAIQTKTTT